MSTVIEDIKLFLIENILIEEDFISDNQPIIGMDCIDSFQIFELLTFINKRYNIKLEDYMLCENKLYTVKDLAEFIMKKKRNSK